jgi:pyridoxal phosphate-dependent aminotransferase EpsN
MSGRESAYIQEALSSDWLAVGGPNIPEFESQLTSRLGLPAVALASGTAAIHLGLRALGVAAGDTVFCQDLTFIASANPIRYLGAEPVFIDSDPCNWNLNPEILAVALGEAARRNRLPKAVVAVHLFGQCADMDPILAECARFGVPVLEDAAEALGASYKGRPAGSLGAAGAFSFNTNKIITATGGGALVSPDPEIIAKARFWANQARRPSIEYDHAESGYNYRMSNILAGVGRGQLEVLDFRVAQRRSVASRYRDAFAGVSGFSPMPEARYGTHTHWLSCWLIDETEAGISRDQLLARLDAAGIEARPVWKPMHLQPVFSAARCYGGQVSEDLFRRGICLPSSSSLSEEEQNRVIRVVWQACPACQGAGAGRLG